MGFGDLSRFERFVLALPRRLRWLIVVLIGALGLALLSFPVWRRLLW
jgi:hypothetical protein